MSGNLIQYQGLSLEDVDAIDEKVQEIAAGDFEQIEVGENVFRIVPTPPPLKPIRVTAMHYVDAVPGLDKMVVFACPRVELRDHCIACAESDRLMKTGNPLDRERAFRISAGVRVYLNVINRKKPDRGVRVLAIGKQVWEQIKTIRKNARAGGDYTDPTANGFDIIIMREGTGKNDTKYSVSADRNNSPLADSVEQINMLIQSTKDLEQYVNPTPSEELMLAWGQPLRQQVGARAGSVAALPSGGSVVAGARAAAQQHVGTVGANVMRPRQAPAPAPSAVVDAQVVDVDNDNFD